MSIDFAHEQIIYTTGLPEVPSSPSTENVLRDVDFGEVVRLTSMMKPFDVFGLGRRLPILNLTPTPESVMLDLSQESLFPQKKNQCGPCVAAAGISYATGTLALPNDVEKTRGWSLPGGRTHPASFESMIDSHGVQVQSYNADKIPEQARLTFLKESLHAGKFVALLSVMHNVFHYIGVVGYTRNEFQVYDPLFWVPEEGLRKNMDSSLPGNCIIDQNKLIHDWSKMNVFGRFFKGYAAMISKVKWQPEPKEQQ